MYADYLPQLALASALQEDGSKYERSENKIPSNPFILSGVEVIFHLDIR